MRAVRRDGVRVVVGVCGLCGLCAGAERRSRKWKRTELGRDCCIRFGPAVRYGFISDTLLSDFSTTKLFSRAPSRTALCIFYLSSSGATTGGGRRYRVGRALIDVVVDAPMPSRTSLARRCHRVATVAATNSVVIGRLRLAGCGADFPSPRRAATLAPAAPAAPAAPPPGAALGSSRECVPGLLLPVPPASAPSAAAAPTLWPSAAAAPLPEPTGYVAV